MKSSQTKEEDLEVISSSLDRSDTFGGSQLDLLVAGLQADFHRGCSPSG